MAHISPTVNLAVPGGRANSLEFFPGDQMTAHVDAAEACHHDALTGMHMTARDSCKCEHAHEPMQSDLQALARQACVAFGGHQAMPDRG